MHNDAHPLSGVRVIDLSMLFPGPLCSLHLADLGAEVIKIENPKMGDATRYMATPVNRNGASISGMYLMLNRNKKSVTINIKRDKGRDVLRRLLKDADILLEGFRPGTLAELGFDRDTLAAQFPRLIVCAISGYGDGSLREHAGHDANYLAATGALSINGPEECPMPAGFQMADAAGGSLTALSAILAALYAREKTGRGAYLDISMTDGAFATLHLMVGETLAGRRVARGRDMLNGGLPNYSVYETADGGFVCLAALEPMFFRTFLKAVGREDLMLGMNDTQPEKIEHVRTELTALFRTRKRDDWQDVFANTDACCTPVLSLEEALESDLLRERGMVFTGEHPELGSITHIGSPFGFTRPEFSPAPSHGEHTNSVLTAAGYSEDEIRDLREGRAV